MTKRVARKLAAAVGVLALAAAVLVGYAGWVEPYWLKATHHRLEAPVGKPIRIVQLSDIHARPDGRRERKLLRLVQELAPDAIVITGDNIRDGSTYADVKNVLDGLRAPLGVYLVKGNWENAMSWQEVGLGRPPEGQTEEDFYRSCGVQLLSNRAVRLVDDVWLVGIDDFTRGKPDFVSAMKGVPEDAYSIALFHSPEYFDRVAGYVDLVLTGHTHGGQVRLPLLPPFYCPAGCGYYLHGWYERDGSAMYISRGVGTSILDFRFNSRPEVPVFTLVPARG